jgi:hypothetical protein
MPIVIITGPPGAGKTTLASQLAASSQLGVHLVGDQVFHWIAGGYVQPWRPGTSRQNGTVISAIAAAAVQFADAGYDVFVDGIIGPWFLPHWLHTTGRGRPTHYFVIRPSRQIAATRATGRRAPGNLEDPHRSRQCSTSLKISVVSKLTCWIRRVRTSAQRQRRYRKVSATAATSWPRVTRLVTWTGSPRSSESIRRTGIARARRRVMTFGNFSPAAKAARHLDDRVTVRSRDMRSSARSGRHQRADRP